MRQRSLTLRNMPRLAMIKGAIILRNMPVRAVPVRAMPLRHFSQRYVALNPALARCSVCSELPCNDIATDIAQRPRCKSFH